MVLWGIEYQSSLDVKEDVRGLTSACGLGPKRTSSQTSKPLAAFLHVTSSHPKRKIKTKFWIPMWLPGVTYNDCEDFRAGFSKSERP
jgi:hypothetical protein